MLVKYMSDIQIEELRKFAVEFVAAEPDRLGSAGFWQEPLIVSAPIENIEYSAGGSVRCMLAEIHLPKEGTPQV